MVGQWFVGHVGGDDFIVILPASHAEDACQEIIHRFDAAVPNLYDEEDRRNGYIHGKDRKGEAQKFPFIGVALVIVSNGDKRYTHPGEISSTASELKSYAKSFQKSTYVMDRRSGPTEPMAPSAAASDVTPAPDILHGFDFGLKSPEDK